MIFSILTKCKVRGLKCNRKNGKKISGKVPLEGGRAPTTIGKCPIFSIYCFYLPKWSTFRAQINVQIKLVLRRHCKIRPRIIKDKPGQWILGLSNQAR